MTQEEKKLLLQDLSSRLPYIVIIKPIDCGNAILKGIKDGDLLLFDIVHNEEYYIPWDIEYCKPYFRPMSSMLVEEAKEIATLHDIKNILSIKITDEYIDVIIDDGICSTETRTIWYDEIISSIECFDWLNAHHFDYRGLIEKGLAIEAPEGMYN